MRCTLGKRSSAYGPGHRANSLRRRYRPTLELWAAAGILIRAESAWRSAKVPWKSPSAWAEGLLLETDAEATPDVADVSEVNVPDVGRLGGSDRSATAGGLRRFKDG